LAGNFTADACRHACLHDFQVSAWRGGANSHDQAGHARRDKDARQLRDKVHCVILPAGLAFLHITIPAADWPACSKTVVADEEAFDMEPSRSKLALHNVSHVFNTPGGAQVAALQSIDLAVPEGRFVSIIGPSGCGKSTLFNIIAGLQAPTEGEVRLDGEVVTRMIGLVGYMLQKDLLLPWRTVLDNVILGMELRGISKSEARERAMPYLQRYGLEGFDRHYPAALSGGMRQRAALLRTLLYDTEVVLLDEPFGALDAQTRSRMQWWLLQLWADFGKTVVFVTHDVDEAVYLSDCIHVMTARPGRIKATLDVPLKRPRDRHVVTEPAFLEVKSSCIELLAEEARDDEMRADDAA
jgi:ABC-type nitrate/sulfonate/bicarbonate transport system ATPase subunit